MDVVSRIRFAHRLVATDLTQLGREDITVSFADEGRMLAITIGNEARVIWLGYSADQGFYLAGEPDQPGERFFQLSERNVRSVILALQSGSETSDGRQTSQRPALSGPDPLIEAVTAPNPDPEEVVRLVDELPATDDGIDILALAATLRSYRVAVRHLKELLDTQHRDHHKEEIYHSLVARNPWMLGALFDQILFREKQLWFGSRADLVVQSVTGYVEIVEFKRPDTPLLVRVKGAPAWLRRFAWRSSGDLADAWRQAERYIDDLDENRVAIQDQLGQSGASVAKLYRSNVLIIAGRSPTDRYALDALRAMSSQSRIMLWTYDDLFSISERVVRLFEKRTAPDAE